MVDPPRERASTPVVLFDGACNFCDSTVRFIIDRDPAFNFRFAALQSPSGQRLLQELGLSPADFETIVLVDECARHHTKSTAILRILAGLRWPWPALYGLIALPRPVRDIFYDLFARNRYRWFGRTDSCRVPMPELRKRFLE